MMTAIAAERSIEGFEVYTSLPSKAFVDLKGHCVIPIGGAIDPFDEDTLANILDMVVEAGTLNGLWTSARVAWGRTARSEHGYADILVDAPEVTEEILRDLIKAGVIS